MSATLASGLVSVSWPATTASATTTDEPAPVTANPVPAQTLPDAPSAHTDPEWLHPTVTLPAAQSVDVTLPSNGRARAGSLPVEVGPAASGLAPTSVRVRMMSQNEVKAMGGLLLGFQLTRADGGSSPATVSVALDYSGITHAYGGDFAGRMRLARVCPACGPARLDATPDRPGRRLVVDVGVQPDPAAATTSEENTGTSAQPDSGFGPQTGDPDEALSSFGGMTMFAVTSGTNGDGGDYGATKVSASDGWDVGLGSGALTYSYPIEVPPAVAGAAPSLSLDYNSQSVDGRSTATNNQPGQVGEGWGFEPGYVERRFHSCKDESIGNNPDLCWSANIEYYLHFGGRSGELVRNGSTNEWRLRGNDPAWRILHYAGSSNGDVDGMTWVVITPDGTKYWFGSGTEPRPSGITRPATNAAWTVPVVAGSGEPCYNAVAALSWCHRAYRWNLDRVLDRNDNVTTYFWTKEQNYYALRGTTQTEYTRSGYLDRVEYGKRNGAEADQAPARVGVNAAYRCVAQSSCPAPTQANASQFPDVPTEWYCPAVTSCSTSQNNSPTFFTTTEITSFTTMIWGGTAYQNVSRYDLSYTFPATGDTTSPSLWLQQVQRTGLYGTTTTLPPVVFGGTPLQNRVNTGTGLAPMYKYRIWYIDTETGGRVTATYGQPHPCPLAPSVPAWDDNPYDCYPSIYEGVWIPFRKYFVTSLLTETTGGQPDQRVDYDYVDTPAWHYADSLLSSNQSWTDYRGHAHVVVTADNGGTTARTRTDYQLFRGMNGDKLANGTAKTYTLTDSFNNTFTDHHYLAGMPLEAKRIALDGSAYETTLHRYWATQTINGPDGWQSHDTQYVRESQRIPRVKNTKTQSSWITRQVDTAYATATGIPTEVSDKGDTAVTGDETCTLTQSVDNTATDPATPNATEWLLGLPYQNTVYSGTACSGTAIARNRSTYDGHAFMAVPTAGNVTQYDAWTGTEVLVSKTTYDPYGRVLTSQTPNQSSGTLKTTTAYNPSTGGYPGNGITVTDAKGKSTITLPYFAWGTPKQITDVANGNALTKFSADGLGRTTEVYRPGDGTTPSLKFAYDVSSTTVNKVTTSTLQSGTTYLDSYAYVDGLGRTVETQVRAASDGDTGRRITLTRYDAQGRVAAESQPMYATGGPGSGQVNPVLSSIPYETRHTYDSGGRENAVLQYAGGAIQWGTYTAYYGPYRQVDLPEHTDVTYYTDVFGRTTQVDEAPTSGTATTTYEYTLLGDLKKITDAASHVTQYTYDWLHRRTSSSDPDSGASSTTYDADGNVKTTTDAKGDVLVNVYDELDRKTDTYLTSTSGTKIAHWDYDTVSPNGAGRLAKATRYVGGVGGAAYVTEVTGYDVKGRATGKKWTVPAAEGVPAGTFTYGYTYDAADRVLSVTMPAAGALAQETVTTTYNQAGLPTTLAGSSSYLSGTTYRNDGRVASRTVPIGTTPVTRSYTYDTPAGRLSRIQSVRGAVTVEDVTYGYDSDSNVTSVTDLTAGVGATPQRECFEYIDGLDRLTRAYTTDAACSANTPNHTFGADPYDVTYTYNNIGDITSSVDNVTASTKTYTYNVSGHAHAVGLVGTGAYTYDANGATLTRPGPGATTLTWNPLHQLDTAVAGTTTTRMVYDADGNRLVRNDGTTAVLYLDGQEIAYTASGTSATRYYGNVAVRDNAGAVTALLRNNQNSATTTVTAAGAVNHQRYLPYGAHRGTTNILTATQRGFLDKPEDPTGFDAIGARYYDPTIARFTSPDPLADLARPQSLAGYTYALGNPETLVDPSGLVAVEPGSSTECDDHRCDPDPNNPVPNTHPQAPPSPPGSEVDPDSESSGGHTVTPAPEFVCTTPATTGAMSCGFGYRGETEHPLLLVLSLLDPRPLVAHTWHDLTRCYDGSVSGCGWAWADLFIIGMGARGARGAFTAAEVAGADTDSALAQASRAAFAAADDTASWTVKAKHTLAVGGRWAKFAEGVDARSAVETALRSTNAAFYANPQIPGTFVVRTDIGVVVGTRGETALRIVVSDSGRIINAFPVK